MPETNRRDFLKLATTGLLTASGILGLGAVIRYLGYQNEAETITEFDLGAAGDYPPGSRTVLADIPALLVHAEDGFHALGLTCTHLGCTVETSETGFICPCHGSEYDSEGRVLTGPAPRPLPQLRVELTSEDTLRLHIDPS